MNEVNKICILLLFTSLWILLKDDESLLHFFVKQSNLSAAEDLMKKVSDVNVTDKVVVINKLVTNVNWLSFPKLQDQN